MAENSLPNINELPQGQTQAAKELDPRTGKVYTNDSRMVSANDVFEPRPEGYDFGYVSDAEAKGMGINPDTHEVCLIRNPDIWEDVEHSDRAREFMAVGGRFIPLHKGKPYTNGDLIYAAKSKEEIEYNRQLEREEANRFAKNFYQGEHGEMEDVGDAQLSPKHPRYNKKLSKEESLQEYERNKADGIIGPTAGRDWLEVVRKNPQQYERDKLDYCLGPVHHNDERRALDEEATQTRTRSGGKFVGGSIPKSVKPLSKERLAAIRAAAKK